MTQRDGMCPDPNPLLSNSFGTDTTQHCARFTVDIPRGGDESLPVLLAVLFSQRALSCSGL